MEDNKALPEPQELTEALKSALQPTATLEIDEEEEWQHDAITMTEENYIPKQPPLLRGSPWTCILDSAQGKYSVSHCYWH